MVVNVYATSATVEQCSRNELLAFVNNFLRANLTRVEEMSSGAAYCQLTELLFPGKISLKKVKWNSRNEVDWIANWRILQTAWKDLGVKKAVPVERLLRAKFQDNFEFLQWFKKFFDANYDGHPYDALLARNGEPLPASWTTSSRSVATKPSMSGRNNSLITSARRTPCNTLGGTAAAKNPTNTVTLQRKYELMIQELKENLMELTKQRDFYYSKLRKVEVLCQKAEDSLTIPREQVLEILYETQEGFAVVDEELYNGASGKIDSTDSKMNETDLTHQLTQDKIDLDTSETF
uniref:EB1 C-terminal domain-containing protein n=1 Tax=Setaria digitata TaxID=48799 RepID=A0A915PLF9_9BILA